MTDIPRSCGILLHPTSLPGRYGVGDLGANARAFVDALVAARHTWWQMLPLNTPGHGGSPYSAESAFAGNPALIDLEELAERELVTREQLDALAAEAATRPADRVDFGDGIRAKLALLTSAYERWKASGDHDAFEGFAEGQGHWLDEYTLYAALKEANDNKSWRDWAPELVSRQPDALEAAREEHAEAIERHAFWQWIFFEQWAALRNYAAERGVKFIGDIPIFVAMDSADVWTHRHLFKLDEAGHADVVAGVPPDYFSKTGQKWGNPVYDWAANEREHYAWWISRVRKAIETVDLVRIDHFRGFQDYWETPADEPTAINGAWARGPRDAFFEAIRGALGHVPFIAEDLGDIDEAVYGLRDRHGLPGMKIMQFAFGGEPDHPFLPHTYPTHCVAYTGTHDNDTTRGWYDALSAGEKHRVRVYLQSSDENVLRSMFRHLYASRAELVVLPAQDLWELGTESRMNTPATVEGNWAWRMTAAQLQDARAWDELARLSMGTRRSPR